MKRFKIGVLGLALCLFGSRIGRAADEAAVLKQIQLLNQVPPDQVNEKTDPGFSILRNLYDQDGPDFLTLRKLLMKSDIRSRLNPSARCVLAGVISQRWDTFSLSGNLYLAGLRSPNPDLRDKARKKIVCFIQPSHIPVLIDTLKVPGPNVLAYEVLQEVTGLHMDPSPKKWQKWWKKTGSKMDIVGHLINDTRVQLKSHSVHDFDQERLWYLPEGVDKAQTPYEKRSAKEQAKISEWNSWVSGDVKRAASDWTENKPILDRIVHQPDPRVNKYLETLTNDPGYGDYASVVLAWRSSTGSLDVLKTAFTAHPTVGRALARGSLGDKTALVDLLRIIDRHQDQPLSYKIMDDETRDILKTLRMVGIVPAEQAFELLCHNNFEFEDALTSKEKKKAAKKAKVWLKENAAGLSLDPRRGYFTTTPAK
jgi:hypothetical protein